MYKNNLKIDIIVSYLKLITNIIIGFLLIPYIIKYLGQSQYGIMNLVNSIVGYVAIMDLGIGQTIIRQVSIYRIKNEKEKENELINYSLGIYLIISFIGFIIGFIIYIFFGRIFTNLNNREIILAQITFIIALLNVLLQIPASAFVSVLSAYNKYSLVNISNMIKLIFRFIVIIFLLKSNFGLISIFICDFILNVIINLYYIVYAIRKIGINISFNKLGKIDIKVKNEIQKYSFFVFLGILTDQIYWRTDNILLGILKSTSAIAVYSISANLVQYYMYVCGNFSSVFLPRLTELTLNDKDNKKTNEFFIKASRYQYIIVLFLFINYIFLGKDFITLWVGKSFLESYYYGLIIIIPLTIPMFQTTGFQILYAKNKHRVRSIMYLVNSIFNIIMSVIFINLYGTIGAAMGTALSMFLGNCIFMNIYYRYEFNLSLKEFFTKVCFKTTIASVPTIIIFLIFVLLDFKEVTLWKFSIKVIIVTILYGYGVFKYSLFEIEKNKIKNYLKKLLLNIKKQGD